MLRTLYRKLFDHELGVVGDALTKAEAKVEDLTTVLQQLQVRFERLQNRVGMRLTRSERDQAGAGSDAEILRNLRNRGGSNDVFDEGWTQ